MMSLFSSPSSKEYSGISRLRGAGPFRARPAVRCCVSGEYEEGERRRTNVVMRSVTRTVPSSVISSLTCVTQRQSVRSVGETRRLTDWYTSQVSANSQHDEPARIVSVREQDRGYDVTHHSGFLTRSASDWGSRRDLTSHSLASLISPAVRCRMKTGFPRHLMMTFYHHACQYESS